MHSRILYIKIILTLVLFFLNNTSVTAQIPLHKLHVRNYTTADGLLSNQVYSIHQDGQGMMWFGGKGLQSYDGYRFKTYVPFDFPQLISYIIDDADNNIYFGNGADLAYPKEMYVLNKINSTYKIFQDSIIIEGKKQKLLVAHTPLKAPDGTVWFALYPNAYAVLKPHAKQLQVVSDNWHLKESIHYRNTFELWNGRYIWQYNCTEGVFRIDTKTNTITSAKNNPAKEKIFEIKFPELLTFCADKDSNFWYVPLKDNTKLIHLKSKNFQSKTFTFPTPNFKALDYIHQIKSDKKGRVWITPSGHSGVAYYNKLKDTLDYMFVSPFNENKLKHIFAFGAAGMNIFCDRENNVWYPGSGVQLFNVGGQQIMSYSHDNIAKDIKATPAQKELVRSGQAISVVQMANKDIYFSHCTSGIIKVDSNGNFPVSVNINIPYDCIRSMFTPDGIQLYFKDSYNGKMYIYNTQTKQTKSAQNEYLNSAIIPKFYTESDTSIYVSDPYKGIVKYNPQNNKITKLPLLKLPEGKEWLIRNIISDGKNALWISVGFCGIIKIDKNTGKELDRFVPDLKKYDDKASANFIGCIDRWNADTLLLATNDGFLIYNTKTKTVKRYGEKEGLADNWVMFCLKDTASGNIWVNGYYKGLQKLNMYTGTFSIPTIDEGNTMVRGSRCGLRTQNGDMLFFFEEGMMLIKKDKKFNNYKPGNVVLTELIVNGKNIFLDSNTIINGVNLTHKQNNISLAFSCLDYFSAKAITYYAFVEGIDLAYVSLGNKPILNYTNMPSGTYTVNLKCAYQNGNFTEKITSFKIHITPPVHQRWWFIGLCLLAFGGILYFIIQWFNKKELAVAKLKNEKLQSELEVEQVNNFFSNALISAKTADEVLWDVSKNLIGKLGFEDCMIYLWNADKTQLIQKAVFGPKGSKDQIKQQPFAVVPGQGVVGYVAQHQKAVIIKDTTKDDRYRQDEMLRLSEICVPIIFNNQLIGVIDSEHSTKDFYTQRHLNTLSSIASLIANKLNAIENQKALETQKREVEKVNTQLAEAQLTALRSQMNPHFIFNSLNSINSVVIEQNTALASDYLTKFSKLIRLILENSKSSLITLATELETLKLYLLMENIRFESKFDYTIIIDENVATDKVKIPPTTLQPFVENAILHGLMHLKQKGHLRITVKNASSNLVEIIIDDNGVGRTKAAELKSSTNIYNSHGYQITKDRILQLHPDNDIKILDKVNEQLEARGTSIIIQLHY